MDTKHISQYADIRVNTTELTIIINALEKIDHDEHKYLCREMKTLYKNMTGKNYGER